ncbi:MULTISPECIES: GerAB/ArcD/ProY family transporter [Bacillus]|uniref:GerAB/ArcD/ProY family transporter n=1 Tax=Bacillus TaxID=1386 RepID=UPI00030B45A0|nr:MULTISPECIES: endospore germination permease [Bacillus]
MNKQHISHFQLIVLIILFQLGSAIFLGVGKEAGKDVWISILLSTVLGILLLYFYITIYSIKPKSSLLELLMAGFGKPLGKVIGFVYSIYFLYMATRVTADFGFFIDNQLSNTNIIVSKLSILILVGYISYLGIETLARSGEIFFFITFLFLSIIFILFTFQDTIEYKNLLPLFSEGNSKIIQAIFPTLLTTPFGEVIVFLCLFHFLRDFKVFVKKGWLAVTVPGIILSLSAIFTIAVLSKELTLEMTFPFIGAIQHITFLRFITHFEVLAVVIFIIGGLIKITIYFYAGIFTLSKVLHIKNQNYFIIPVLFLMFLTTHFFMKNYIEHITLGITFMPYYIHLFFQIYLPLILLIILFLRRKKIQHSSSN